MAAKTAENVAVVQIFGTLDGQEVMNDLYYQFATPRTHVELVEIVAAVSDVVEETWLSLLPTSWVGRSVFAYDATVSDGANAVDDAIVGMVGTSGTTALPNNVAPVVARKNGLRGRAGNGRVFWMGVGEGALEDANNLDPTFATALVSALATVDSAIVALDGTPVILSYQKDGIISDAATIYPLADWTVVSLVVGSRRKRLPKRA
jgi:hypothetical protein